LADDTLMVVIHIF